MSFNSVSNPSLGEAIQQGSCVSEIKDFSYSFSKMRGERAAMETFLDAARQGGLFDLSDGHGGSRAADNVEQNLFKNLLEYPLFLSDTKVAIADTFKQPDQDHPQATKKTPKEAGSTPSSATLDGANSLNSSISDSTTLPSGVQRGILYSAASGVKGMKISANKLVLLAVLASCSPQPANAQQLTSISTSSDLTAWLTSVTEKGAFINALIAGGLGAFFIAAFSFSIWKRFFCRPPTPAFSVDDLLEASDADLGLRRSD